jgi:hypothetical protein
VARLDERRDGCGALEGQVKVAACFDEVVSRFWDPSVRSGVQVPLTDQAIIEVECELGHVLPHELVQLLRVQNGGYLRDDLRAHPSPEPTSWAATWVPFDQCFGVGHDGSSLFDPPYLVQEWGLPDGLVLLSGDGHSWIALDYREAAAEDGPPVIYVDAESRQVVRLAGSFRHFVEGLMPEPGDDES